MSRRWWWRRPVDDKPTVESLEQDLTEATNRLADVARQRNLYASQVEALRAAADLRESQLAAAREAATDQGNGKKAAEERLDRIRAILAADLPPDVRLAQIHQVLTEGRTDG